MIMCENCVTSIKIQTYLYLVLYTWNDRQTDCYSL